MTTQHDRTVALIGEDSFEILNNSRVAVFGLGGVGSYAAESLARSGIGSLLIADCDTVSVTNINRQLPALNSTVGMYKTAVVKERLYDINPLLIVDTVTDKITEDTPINIFDNCDYIIDAIDDVPAKMFLIKTAKSKNIPIISSMGTGNKTDILALQVADIFDTSVCPLCRSMRKRLRDQNIDKLKVVYSREEPKKCTTDEDGKTVPSSMIFVPAAAGLLLARETVFDIVKKRGS